jgi:eukaryotic-like serine/threonine-protein kinase
MTSTPGKFSVPSEVYQQAKAILAELADASESERATRLQSLKIESPEIEREVRSLLDYHTAQSLVAIHATPKIRTRSTLNTTYQASMNGWLLPLLKSLAIITPVLILAWIFASLADKSIHASLRSSLSQRLAQELRTRETELREWQQQQLHEAQALCQAPVINAAVRELVAIAKDSVAKDGDLPLLLRESKLAQKIADELRLKVGTPVKFTVWDRKMVTLADWNQDEEPGVLGSYLTPATGASMLAPVLNGHAKLSLPRLGNLACEDPKPESSSPMLPIYVPVQDAKGVVIAALMLHGYGVEEKYRDLIASWSDIASAETYLINSSGAMITASRYGEQLDAFDLATDSLGARALLVRDPGANLMRSEKPEDTPFAWPPTLMARNVVAGNDGLDADGYRNYVGEFVVGAWKWLPDEEVGMAFEEPYDVAYSMAHAVRSSLWWLSSIFTLGLFAVALVSTFGGLPRRRLRSISEVGPYQIQELLGEGGMGRVYLAEHALLCRYSAIKVLTKGAADQQILSRFEREVQLASQLTHPNTIAIYDFGRNKDGVFYYAMEYVNGGHLGQLIEYAGPLAPGRCIYILQQLCRALNEAHQAGVVHRDIKPQNIMVCNRGGEPDFVKLFDYGLVKAFAPGVSHNIANQDCYGNTAFHGA